MKHCTDCKYFRPKDDSEIQFGLCTHPKAQNKDSDKLWNWLVMGTGDDLPTDIKWSFAKTMRQFECGRDAKLFEPKPDTEAQSERRKDHEFDAKGQA